MMELAWLPALPAVTEKQLYKLFYLLWDLGFCQPCLESNFGADCHSNQCPRRTALTQYNSFVAYYKKICASYDPPVSSSEAALRSHDDVGRIVEILRRHPEKPKGDIHKLAFPTLGDALDQDNAINLAVSIFAMSNCGSQESSPILLEEGSNRITWRAGITLSQYIELVLPRSEGFESRQHFSHSFLDPSCPMVMAKDLKRLAGTSICGTDDITNHLRYDVTNNVLFIFRHARILKEHLRLSKNCGNEPSLLDCLNVGAMPRQYVLEVLYSTQKIVFPLWDSDSVGLLQSLVVNAGFDKSILDGQDHGFIRDDEERIDFQYLSLRLYDIFQEIQNPRPRGRLAKWLDRRSGARYVILATIAGLLFAVFLGIASLTVSSYQTYLAYQAWRHPAGIN
ncbi:hypothetical protein BGZ61DRAFT_384043 [Ilyonectria robusta]|uniref:uncharacterized protein n=1 Tax=Ilyonectria robusta TaxID=1079257 RepID=UPI001E8CD801|nr:uncharacterized protein BGZ61DRAFT_384043 [Ilyonectria robusta]KAH8733693.1 hypothetical protein BGZ61DRAFT_384043 [Ilyonectria robusta]